MGVTGPLVRASGAGLFVRRGADSNYGDLHSKPFLLRACALGLDELAMTMLQQGADARAADGSGVTPLHAAAAESSPFRAARTICSADNPPP